MFIIKNSTLVSLPISSSSALSEISNFAGNSVVEGKKQCEWKGWVLLVSVTALERGHFDNFSANSDSLWIRTLTGYSNTSPPVTTMQVKVRWSLSLAAEISRLEFLSMLTRTLYSSVALIETFWFFCLTSRYPGTPSPLSWRAERACYVSLAYGTGFAFAIKACTVHMEGHMHGLMHSDWAWFDFRHSKWALDLLCHFENNWSPGWLTYFHLVMAMSSAFMAPLLHGILSISPYWPIIGSKEVTAKEKHQRHIFNCFLRTANLVTWNTERIIRTENENAYYSECFAALFAYILLTFISTT